MDYGFTASEDEERGRIAQDVRVRQTERYLDGYEEEIKRLAKENIKLKEHIVYLKKNGYRYDQLSTKMILCARCGDLIIRDF